MRVLTSIRVLDFVLSSVMSVMIILIIITKLLHLMCTHQPRNIVGLIIGLNEWSLVRVVVCRVVRDHQNSHRHKKLRLPFPIIIA